ncbi:prepilin-type N-terminal cleavage/methylation domain-containing protein [bacterium]|nr:prepilin-type N-terminal cleavage/methylation domain-containing protein [Candidatus Elulimicrobium humile]
MQKGFSLSEILVSVAIIGILSGIGIQAFVSSRQRAKLEEDVAKVVQALRKAQNSALAPSRSETGIATGSTLCAIGVKITSSTSARTIQPIYQTGTTSCSGENNYGTATTLNHASINANRVITFNIPFAETSGSGGRVELSIDNGGNSISKTIEVTNTGLIQVE